MTEPPTSSPRSLASPKDPQKSPRSRAAWAFLLLPLVGIAELGAEVAQAHAVVPESDWVRAREAVKKSAKESDLVAFAPAWIDPVGRRYFGDELATLRREARPDESRFARAIEVSIRGKHLPAFARWKQLSVEHEGAITLTTYENPSPVVLRDDLVNHIRPGGAHVTRVEGDREAPCDWVHTGTQAGGLGAGPAVPGDRFNCPGNVFVGMSVLPDLDYAPRRCIYAPPPGGRGATRIHFEHVKFGRSLRGHHGLYAEAERDKTGSPVTLTFKVGERILAESTHNDGDGWAAFEFDTSDLEGQERDLAVFVSSSAQRRAYCFEADTR